MIDYSSWETWGWFGFIAYFLALEGWGLYRSRPGDTLSEHIWVWFGTQRGQEKTKKRSGWVQLRRVILIAFMAWLTIHFLTGGWAWARS